MVGKTIMVLGGGVGGIVTANALRRRLDPQHRVIVVDKQGKYVFTPSLLWVMVGWRRPAQITKDLQLLLHPGIEVLRVEVEDIIAERSALRAGGRELAYDYLVVALGADLVPADMPGFAETAHTPFNLAGATCLRSALQCFRGGRVAVVVSATPFKCPAVPYETALLLDDYFRRRGMRDRVDLSVYTPEPAPMGAAGPLIGRAVVDMLAAKDIGFYPKLNLTRIDPIQKELIFEHGENSLDEVRYDLLVGVPPHRPPPVVQASALANEAGWVPVNHQTLATRFENVYAIGDVTSITLANGKSLPKAGVFAHSQGKTVAARIAGTIHGATSQAEFDGTGYCWIEMGGGNAGFASGQFYAEPEPHVLLPHSGRAWHIGKVLFEQYWLGEGAFRQAARLGLNLGAKLFNVPVSL